MHIQETRSRLTQLKLFGMAEAIDQQLSTPNAFELPFEDRLGLIVGNEITFRENRRMQTLLKMAKMKYRVDLSEINYDATRNISRTQIASLSICDWITRGFNVLITGPTGTGKTFLSCAFGRQSCLKGLSVQFHKVGAILGELKQADVDGSLLSRLKSINRCSLLILDDLGIKGVLGSKESELLYELIDGRHPHGATLITSQLPTNNWHGYLHASNPTSADAIMDRVLTNATKIELKGESLRPHNDVFPD